VDWLQSRVAQLEKKLGLPLVLRPMHVPDPAFRGRITKRADRIVLEYRDEVPGFFWHHDILRELFAHLEQGRFDIALYDDPGPQACEKGAKLPKPPPDEQH